MKSWKQVFAVIWAGQFMSILSSTTVNFAIILWLSIKTGSAEILAYAAFAALLPQVILGPVAGVYVDRWNRKLVMILADSFIAVCTLILSILFWLDIAEMWHIFILLGLRSVGSSFHMPAMEASVPLLAPQEQLTRVAGINQIIISVGNIAGPALGAFFITIWDIEYVLLLDVGGAFIACTSLLFVHIPNPEKIEDTAKNILREMKEGITAVLKNRGLSWVFLYSVFGNLFIMPVSILFPLMTLQYFGGDKFQVSLVEALWGVGALIGGIIMGIKVYNINRIILHNFMYMVLGLTFLFSGLLSPAGFVWFAVLTAIGGVSGSIFNTIFISIVQVNIDPAALGRVFSMYFTVGLIPSLIGLLGVGFIADNVGLTRTFVLCGGILVILGVLLFFNPSAMRLDSRKRKKE